VSFIARTSRVRWSRPSIAGLGLCALLLPTPAAFARINVVTLPGRDTVQLTIYNSATSRWPKETRVLTFRKGLNGGVLVGQHPD